MTITVDAHTPAAAAPDDVPSDRPRWVTPALLGLLAATAVLYLWGLGSSGWANSYLRCRGTGGHAGLDGLALRLP